MASEARASQFVSSCNFWSVAVAKNFVPLIGGCPNGLSSPALTSTGMSCGANPSSHAASSATTRAGGVRHTIKNSFRSGFILKFYSSVSFKNLSISEAGMSLWRKADEL
jgi:hypothetical protein